MRGLRTRRLLILGWHNVEGTFAFPSPPGTGTAGFARQLQFLARVANVVDLGEALADLRRGRTLSAPAVALTFDDGYRDNGEVAAPMLSRLGLPATFFLSPELLSGRVPWWEEVAWAFHHSRRRTLEWEGMHLGLAGVEGQASCARVCKHLKGVDEQTRRRLTEDLIDVLQPEDPQGRPPSPIMGWDDARSLVHQGFAVGSHSLRHAILANEPAPAQKEDLAESRRLLEERLAVGVDLLAYPNGGPGDFDATTTAAAAAAGYEASVTTIDGLNDPATPRHELRRFLIYPERGVTGFGILPRHALRRVRSAVIARS